MPADTAGAVLDILGDVLELPAEDLRKEPDLKSHGWDSVATLEALARLEQHFDVKFDLREFAAARTADEVVALTEGERS
ncbi:acyl carrier protein [Actinomadura macrotermitis]|uniref:Carrier domain-containing protein n=1 Tax=Actinomadura macrotermitis TaxID=2585200 RepID=A0A7K0BZ40_9ACTN|nr:acyl carrier protein [Actinomadura macrotermitis]MQY06441.1 hypothetical protein [Actinomadura macrotermitis]